LGDEPTANPVKRLKIELFRALERHEPHGRPLDGFGNRFRIAAALFAFKNHCLIGQICCVRTCEIHRFKTSDHR
jgi:hypothetical protein